MKLNSINFQSNKIYSKIGKKKLSEKQCNEKIQNSNYSIANLKANYHPLSFKGNADNIHSAFLISKEENDIPLLETKENGSYVVDFDTQTEVIYGKNAIEYLNKNSEFPFDTQIIIPKKCEAIYETDDKKIELKENSAVMINGGSAGKITIKKGYPMVIISKKDYDWYERYNKDCDNVDIRKKFEELATFNAHSFNAEFKRNKLQESIVQKLLEKGFIEEKNEDYIRFSLLYKPEFLKEELRYNEFSEEEISKIIPIYTQTRQLHTDTRFGRTSDAKDFTPELLEKLKSKGIIYNNKKQTETVFWKQSYQDETELRLALYRAHIYGEDVKEIISKWRQSNKAGYDLSGLKFIDNHSAVYNLDDKSNNWTLEATNWVTNSTALTSKKGKTPFIGTSLVQTEKNKIFTMDELRKGEQLHKHPNRAGRKQTELYMITSGVAALEIVKNGKAEIKLIKEGELAVIDAGVEHCVNSVLGEYEQIVVQVPSAFQYGFEFKENATPPANYNKEKFTKEANFALTEAKRLNLV